MVDKGRLRREMIRELERRKKETDVLGKDRVRRTWKRENYRREKIRALEKKEGRKKVNWMKIERNRTEDY